MSDLKLLSDLREGVLTLTLNRPGKLNAIDNALACSLREALRTGATEESVRVIVLRGNGRAFCAGRDIGAAPTDEDLVLVQAVAEEIVRLPKPVVAQVHGWTVGAGLEWALCADVVVASEDTRFMLPEASLGVFVTGGLSATLPAAVGLTRAKGMAFLGEAVSARQAFDWGLVWKVVAAADHSTEVMRIALRLASLSPDIAMQFKRVFNLMGLAAFDNAVKEENSTQRLLMRQA